VEILQWLSSIQVQFDGRSCRMSGKHILYENWDRNIRWKLILSWHVWSQSQHRAQEAHVLQFIEFEGYFHKRFIWNCSHLPTVACIDLRICERKKLIIPACFLYNRKGFARWWSTWPKHVTKLYNGVVLNQIVLLFIYKWHRLHNGPSSPNTQPIRTRVLYISGSRFLNMRRKIRIWLNGRNNFLNVICS